MTDNEDSEHSIKEFDSPPRKRHRTVAHSSLGVLSDISNDISSPTIVGSPLEEPLKKRPGRVASKAFGGLDDSDIFSSSPVRRSPRLVAGRLRNIKRAGKPSIALDSLFEEEGSPYIDDYSVSS